jgi:glutamyl-Q tRNA(Asp) synthetase
MAYCGRFAPSPSGPLHLGSLVAALASWLDARAHGGRWLVRIEDLDPPREQAGAAQSQIVTLARLGLLPDEPPLFQSARTALYERALARLQDLGRIYPCSCSRGLIELDARRRGLPPGVANIYTGRCRNGPAAGGPRSRRLRVPVEPVGFTDRACGPFSQSLEREVGDFIVRRADGLWSYQLAVVVDDADQGITDVVRGADLLDNTPRQICLQRLLGLPTPRYLHVPLVRAEDGQKLSKQNGARPLDPGRPLRELEAAWEHLGFARTGANSVNRFLQRALLQWSRRWLCCGDRADIIQAGRNGPAAVRGSGPEAHP